MSEPPSDLLSVLPSGTDQVVRKWWSSLSEEDQVQLSTQWDNRLEVCFFARQPDSTGRLDEWEQVPGVVGGRFVPTDDTTGLSEWGPGYFEYLLSNPELIMAYEPSRRTFHIGCQQHAAGKKCIERGEIAVDFRCPISTSSCPFEALRGSSIKRPGHDGLARLNTTQR
jgi:hypothetical protein